MLVGVTLNLTITMVLSLLGVILFKIFWLKKDRTKLPNYKEKELFLDPRHDRPQNGLIGYFANVASLLAFEDVSLMIDRIGFENYFFIQYHRYLAMSFFFASAFVIIFILVSKWISGLSWDSFAKEMMQNDQISIQKRPLDTTIIMVIITYCVSWGCSRVSQSIKNATLQKFKKACQDPLDSYHYSFRTALLSAEYPENLSETQMIKFLQKAQVGSSYPSKLLLFYSLHDHKKVGRSIVEMDSANFFYDSWIFSALRCCTSKCFSNRFSSKKNLDGFLRRKGKELSELKLKHSQFSGFSVCLFENFRAAEHNSYLLKNKNFIKKMNLYRGGHNKESQLAFLEGTRYHEMTFDDQIEIEDKDTGNYLRKRFTLKPALDTHDIVWDNIHVRTKFHIVKKSLLFILAVAMFFFLSTPSAFIQLMKYNIVSKEILSLNWEEKLGKKNYIMIRDYFTILLTLISNKLYLVIITVFGRNQSYFLMSQYHNYILTQSFYYLLVNMIVMPELTLSFGIITKNNFSVMTILRDMYLLDSGSFFVNLILQAISYNVLFDLNRMADLMNFMFSFEAAAKFRANFKQNRWKLKEIYTFTIGYKYAESATFAILISSVATFSPILLLMGFVYFGSKFVVDSASIFSNHNKELEGYGVLAKSSLSKSYWGLILGHLIILAGCLIHGSKLCVFINLVLILATLVNYQNMLRETYLDLAQEAKLHDRKLSFDEEGESRWLEHYQHPVKREMELISSARGEEEEDLQGLI